MRVAYLVNQYPHVSHTFIRREIAALEDLGVEVLRCSIRPSPTQLVDAADLQEREKTKVLLDAARDGRAVVSALSVAGRPRALVDAVATTYRLGRVSERGLARHAAYLAEAAVLVDLLRRERVTHLHAHFGTNSAAVAMLARALGGPPFSFTVHGPEEFDAPRALRLAEKTSAAAFVVAISEFSRSQLYRVCALSDWGKIHVIRCGVDRDYLDAPPSPPPAHPELVCVARLAEQKGLLVLVEAVADLASRGIDVVVRLCGDGPLRGVLEERIAALGLERRLTISGWLDADAIRSSIRGARALVLPSFAEGLPVVIMEALALHRPVITTWVAGIPELVEHRVNGWLVPAGDAKALAHAMEYALAADPSEIASMGARGAARVRAQHDVSRSASALAALFEQSASG